MWKIAALLPLALLPLKANDLAHAPEADILSAYQQLRAVALDPNRSAIMENFILKKDGGAFEFRSGSLYFFQPVAEHVAGAVFLGQGVLRVAPPNDIERRQLGRFLDGKTELEEPFEEAVLVFSDATFAELERGLKFRPAAVPPRAAGVLEHFRKTFRDDLTTNVEAQLLAGLTCPREGMFLADVKGEKHGRLLFSVDPFDGEPVQLIHYNNALEYFDRWCSFRPAGSPPAVAPVHAVKTDIDSIIDKGRKLAGEARTDFTAMLEGDRVLMLHLAPTLRVSKALWGAAPGRELKFIQEPKKKDADLWVILPEPLEKGKSYTLALSYEGDEVVRNGGNGNFYVGQRTRWYPRLRTPADTLEDRTLFHMRFQTPKEFTLVATGKPSGMHQEGKTTISEWDTVVPYGVVGFNYGTFKPKSFKDGNVAITVFANEGLGDELAELKVLLDQNPEAARQMGITTGGFNTTRMADQMLAESVNSMRLFTHYFGPVPFESLSVTQQPSGVFGQSWPTLVFMPYTSFLDSTTQQQLGLRQGSTREFLDEVGSHEIAHQWWGHLVGWKTYHDQWLSEGFAQYSAGLYTHRVKGEKKFKEFMAAQRNDILQSQGDGGPAANSAGPIWLGYRLSAEKAPGAYRLVYAKGAYVLHMLRMMLYDFARNDDSRFVQLMRDFTKEYANQSASTEDFKGVVDRHFGQDMGWFFNQWVYGTEIPRITVEYTLADQEKGAVMKGTVRQSGVSPEYRSLVPFVLRYPNNGAISGKLQARGPATNFTVALPARPEGVEFNPLESILGDVEVKKL